MLFALQWIQIVKNFHYKQDSDKRRGETTAGRTRRSIGLKRGFQLISTTSRIYGATPCDDRVEVLPGRSARPTADLAPPPPQPTLKHRPNAPSKYSNEQNSGRPDKGKRPPGHAPAHRPNSRPAHASAPPRLRPKALLKSPTSPCLPKPPCSRSKPSSTASPPTPSSASPATSTSTRAAFCVHCT